MKKSEEGITAKKEKDFSEWYQQLILKSDLADYTSVSGCIVFKPTAWAIWEKIRDEVDKRIKNIDDTEFISEAEVFLELGISKDELKDIEVDIE